MEVNRGMRKLIEQSLEDLSTRDAFLFRVRCGYCGQAYANRPVRFTKAGITPASAEKRILFDVIYDQEHRAARTVAIRSMAEHFNLCPVCRRMVCNRCFLICDDLDMCAACAARLKEDGMPVLSEVPEESGFKAIALTGD